MSDEPKISQSDRRSFLKKTIGFLGAAMAAAMATPPLIYLLDPITRKTTKNSEDWTELGPINGFELNVPRRIAINKTRQDAWLTQTVIAGSTWVVKTQESPVQFDVLSTICPHLGCAIVSETDSFRCPCHKSRFSLSGTAESGPSPRAMDSLNNEVRDGVLYCQFRRFKTDQAEKIPVDEA